MTASPSPLVCTRCAQPLDATDNFCRQCGLPTNRAPAPPPTPPDTQELKRAFDIPPDPRPFERAPAEATPPPDSTGQVMRATSPTHMTQLAGSTALMIGLIVLLAVAGVVLLGLALWTR